MNTPSHPKIIWTIESTHPDLVEPLKEGLKTVMDPEIGLSVVDLGLVRDVFIVDKNASIDMMMTTPFCPYAPALLEMTRQKAEECLKLPTTIEFNPEPWDPSMMDEAAAAAWGFF